MRRRAAILIPALCSMLGVGLLLTATAARGGGESEPKPHASGQAESERGHEEDDRRSPWRREFDADSLTVEEIETVMQVVEAGSPLDAERLRSLREDSESRFREAIASIASNRRMRWFLMIRQFDARGYEVQLEHLRAESDRREAERQLAQLYAKRDRGEPVAEEKIERAEQRLRDAAEAEFDAELRVREHEIDRFERRIEELLQRLAKRRERKATIVEEHFEEARRRAQEGRPSPPQPLRDRDRDGDRDRGRDDDRRR